jgi:hypothetical protein
MEVIEKTVISNMDFGFWSHFLFLVSVFFILYIMFQRPSDDADAKACLIQ